MVGNAFENNPVSWKLFTKESGVGHAIRLSADGIAGGATS